jgi:hypothetical protein
VTAASSHTVWFGRVVSLGVLANLTFSLPAIFVPELTLRLLSFEPALPHIWVRFSGMLLLLLSLFYLPAAWDLHRYRANAYLSVVARVSGAAFFGAAVIISGRSRAYLLFCLVDLAFTVGQGTLLILALRREARLIESTGAYQRTP